MTTRQRRPTGFDALRRSRAVVVAFALLGMLFAQTALAFYSCPQLSSLTHEQSKPPPCAEMDMESPALCKAFVQGDTQGLDGKRSAIDYSAVAPPPSAPMPSLWLPTPQVRRAARRAPLRTRPPPLWITLGRHRD